jgi:hypothetical protein
MGRRLEPDRRAAAIAYWRQRLDSLGAVSAGTFRDRLVELLGPEASDRLAATRRPLAVIRELRSALQAAAHGSGEQLDAWIGPHLVDRGPALLVSDAKRTAALAHIRDSARRARRRDAPRQTVTIPVSVETAAKLRAFTKANAQSGPEAAVVFLLRHVGKKGRSESKPSRSAAIGDLFDTVDDSGDQAPQAKKSRPTRRRP